jgi:hypothetical protein
MFVRNEVSTDKMFLHTYAGGLVDELDKQIYEILSQEGYRITGGKNGAIHYETGSHTLHIILGGLVKYSKISVRLDEAPNGEIRCEVHNLTASLTGGLVGYKQPGKEIRNLNQIFRKL